MAFCSGCGAAVADGAAFCPKCGRSQAGGAPAAGKQSGLAENIAGPLCYALGWVTGIIFYLIDRRPFVRFHAAQSIVVFGGLHIARIVLGGFFGLGWIFGGLGAWSGFTMGWGLLALLQLLAFALWIVCMIKAGQGERFKVPLAGELAESFAKS